MKIRTPLYHYYSKRTIETAETAIATAAATATATPTKNVHRQHWDRKMQHLLEQVVQLAPQILHMRACIQIGRENLPVLLNIGPQGVTLPLLKTNSFQQTLTQRSYGWQSKRKEEYSIAPPPRGQKLGNAASGGEKQQKRQTNGVHDGGLTWGCDISSHSQQKHPRKSRQVGQSRGARLPRKRERERYFLFSIDDSHTMSEYSVHKSHNKYLGRADSDTSNITNQ